MSKLHSFLCQSKKSTVSSALGDRSKKCCCNLCQSVLPILSSQSLMLTNLKFKSLIHLEVICIWVRECSNFILLHVAAQFCQYNLLKKLYFFSHFMLPLFHRLIDHRYMVLFLGSLFCSIDLCVYICASTILL